jgi:hypothetical protein
MQVTSLDRQWLAMTHFDEGQGNETDVVCEEG